MQPLKWNPRYDSRPGANDRAFVATDPGRGDRYRVQYAANVDRWLVSLNGSECLEWSFRTSQEGRVWCDALRIAAAIIEAAGGDHGAA